MNPIERASQLNSKVEVPSKEEIVSMTKEQLDALIKSIEGKYSEKLEKAITDVEKLRVQLERDSEVRYVKNKGDFADPTLEIRQLGPLGPIDHQEAAIKDAGVEDQLKGKATRFVSTNAELRSLRRSQGYDPVLDKVGNEVRYMDGVLMAMPQARYDETIKNPKKLRQQIHKRSIKERLEETGRKHGVEVYGDGIQYDRGDV